MDDISFFYSPESLRPSLENQLYGIIFFPAVAVMNLDREGVVMVEKSNVLVTGGARGIGAGIVRELIRQGHRVGLCGRSGADSVAGFLAELAQMGGDAAYFPCDVSCADDADVCDTHKTHLLILLRKLYSKTVDTERKNMV